MMLDRISLSFGEQSVLREFGLSLSPGSVTCLMGPSGCGKTSVLRLILGLIKPDSGTVLGFSGLRTGVVFQEDRLVSHLSASANVQLVAAQGVTKPAIARMLNEVGLEAKTGAVETLSGGEKRRVAVVRALLHHPCLLLLDEPFRGLDDGTRAQVATVIRQAADGATVLLVTHDKEDALRLGAERIQHMEKISTAAE